MQTDKDDKLKQLLKQADADKTAEGFTESVMKMIEGDTVRETTLKVLLKQHPAEGPSFDFTAAVMRQINVNPKPFTIRPIITKKAWYVITAVFTLTVLTIVVLPDAAPSNAAVGDSSITSVINQLQAVPATYVLAAVAVAVLLLGDYLLTQRSKKAVLN
ncbi:hypothetical protein [Mucilaginibacter panaciglaebae]|uniref:Uncharacterized protein n=1 Tax=Mucilaginibacter panaciglaebae TaxID=502331 RepID=A0ABP7WQ18_9SPHI